MLNSAAGLGSSSNPGRGGEGKGRNPETCWRRFAPMPWAKVGLCRWKWQWGLWEMHASTSLEGQRPAGLWGVLKGPQKTRGGPRAVPMPAGAGGSPTAEAGPCSSAVSTANSRCGERLGARLRWHHPWLFLPPGAQVSRQSFRIPRAKQTAAMCQLGWGNAAAWRAWGMLTWSSGHRGLLFTLCPLVPA